MSTRSHSGARLLEQIHHLFLLKRLPSSGNHDELVAVEEQLLGRITRVLGRTFSEFLPALCKTINAWENVQKQPLCLGEALSGLAEKESLCVYIRMQNCVAYFTQLDQDHVRIITFRASLPNEVITKTNGCVLVTYPETVDIVPKSEFLVSEFFSRQIVDLTLKTCEAAMPKSTRGFWDFEETWEPSSTFIVSEFLITMLCPVDSSTPQMDGNLENYKFQKKIRDQINKKGAGLPFRRSGLWTSAKAVLTLSLNQEMSSLEDAKLAYKTVLLEVLLDTANEYLNSPNRLWDESSQIMVKLARRAKKLSMLTSTPNSYLEEMRDRTLANTSQTVERYHTILSKEWEATVNAIHGPYVDSILREDHDWEKDCLHVMTSLAQYLNKERPLENSASAPKNDLKISQGPIEQQPTTISALLARRPTSSKELSNSQANFHLNAHNTWIHHVEWFVRNLLDENHDPMEVAKLFENYWTDVNPFCLEFEDPIYYSRIVVTALKMVCVLDKIAVRAHPLLEQYRTGIDGKIFANLLLPEKADMLLVEAMTNYFNARNSNAPQEDWLKMSSKSEHSLACKFAKGSPQMQALKDRILADMNRRIEIKKEEVKRARLRCENLQSQAEGMECNEWRNWRNGRSYHRKNRCNLCLLERSLREAKTSVSRYQRPLPPDDSDRDVVVFELLIPKELAYYRDCALIFLEEIVGHEKLGGGYLRQKWMEFSGLSEYPRNSYQKHSFLGSSTMDTLNTHYRDNPNVLSGSPDSFSEFVIENGMNLKYFRSPLVAKTSAEKPLIYKIYNTRREDSVLYEPLQFALAKRSQNLDNNENNAIASQYKCHPKLSLREFKAYGTLRCANLVQLRNLYADIASKTVSLDKEPVLELIMQALFELGPGTRENHVDVELEENEKFAEAFLETLRKTGEENATNWSNPVVLLSLVTITTRILVMTNSLRIQATASEQLRRFREILSEWMKTIDKIVRISSDPNEMRILMQSQLKCALSMMFTFNVLKCELMSLQPMDVTYYLQGLACLHQLLAEENSSSKNTPSKFMSNLLRHARVTIPLCMQTFLERCLQESSYNESLHDVVAQQWLAAKNETCKPTYQAIVYSHTSVKNVFRGTYLIDNQYHEAVVDTLRGSVMVDEYPPSVLPASITGHSLFKSYFQTSQFRVQRDSSTFQTIDKYQERDFTFRQIGSEIIIQDIRPDGAKYELIPSCLFEGLLQSQFIQAYTHWYDPVSKRVLFRYRSEVSENKEDDVHYVMEEVAASSKGVSNQWYLVNYEGIEVPSAYKLLSVQSEGYQKITENLRRLEDHHNHIHVQLSQVDNTITAKLRRYGLSFTLCKTTGHLYCENYPGFYVAPMSSQILGTLTGLQNGLLLVKSSKAETSGAKKIFLVTHGTVSIDRRLPHQRVVISIEHGTAAGYFLYEVDQVLHRLKPGSSKSAWLYLALLHASTSSPFPDPFTKLTGTEMAMWILQSGYCWSCSPYDSDCHEIIRQIAFLSPTYKAPNQLKNILNITWPTGLDKNSYAAYDGYAIVTQRFFHDSYKLAGLFVESPGVPEGRFDVEQCLKSYQRNVNIYNRAAHIDSAYMPPIYSQTESVHLAAFRNSGNDSQLATFALTRLMKVPVQTQELCSKLILTREPLQHQVEDIFTERQITDWIDRPVDLRANWFVLYSLAQSQSANYNVELYYKLTIMYGALLYSGNGSLEQLLNLHNIEFTPGFTSKIESLTGKPYSPLEGNFKSEVISSLVGSLKIEPPKFEDDTLDRCSESWLEAQSLHKKKVEDYKLLLSKDVQASVNSIRETWPTKSVSSAQLQRIFASTSHLNYNSKSSV